MKKLLFVLLLLPMVAMSQGGKAYEVINYQASDSLQGKIIFHYTLGLCDACSIEAKVKGKKEKIIFSFTPEQSSAQWKVFCLFKNNKLDQSKRIALQLNCNGGGDPPSTITGYIPTANGSIPITFLRLFNDN